MATVDPHSPEELGLLLGLEQGLDGRAAEILTMQAISDIGIDQLSAGLQLKGSEAYDYWQAFASLYLPSLLRTFVRDTSLPKDVPVYTSFRWYGTWVLHTTRSPAFSRFFRLHTEVALRFFLSLVELVASIDADFLQTSFTASDIVVIIKTFGGCCLGYGVALGAVIESTRVLSFSYATFGRLRRLIPFVKLHCVDFSVTYRVWMSCEALRGESSGTADGPVSCAEVVAEGVDQMEMCAQCESVRYCGRAHQKLDWKKRHKAVCMKPSW